MTALNLVESPTITTETVMVSSEQARKWLEYNHGPNRKIATMKVLQFQSDMESGRWVFDAAPLRFDDKDLVIDGQHRLTALANCPDGTVIPFLVVRGLPTETQLVMDQGQVRTVAQQLDIKGVRNSAIVAAATRLYLDWTRARLFRSTSRSGATTRSESIEWAMDHSDLFEALFDTDFRHVDAPASVTGAFGLAVLQIAPERAKEFFRLLSTGAGMNEGHPILALDRRLRNIRRHGQKVSSREMLFYFIKAWNAWVTNTPLAKLQISRYGVTEELFPVLLPVRDTQAA